MPDHIRHIRTHYEGESLDERSVAQHPLNQFDDWLDAAFEAGVPDPNAMILATSGKQGMPSMRVVLLKDVDAQGLSFYTNYTSRKAQDLSENSQASLLFFWPQLHRQIRISGTVSKTDRRQSETYFRERPRESQLAAWASAQSSVIESRAALMDRYKALEADYQDHDVPFPEFWGGYCLAPVTFEFWQGQPNRLHDRICYTLQADTGTWSIQRLAP